MKRLLILLLTAGLLGAQGVGTDINPALRYYQAFLEASQVPEADREYVATNDWRGKKLDARFGEIISRYDYQFRLLREASRSRMPCDWGVDLSLGPETVLPALAPAKIVSRTASARVLWSLQNGKEEEAKADFLAAYALARYLSHDRILISALVQFAMEQILLSNLAWNYGRYKPETLQAIMEGINNCPRRGSIADTVFSERVAFLDWYSRRLDEIAARTGGDHAAAKREIKAMLDAFFIEPGDEGFSDLVVEKGGGTVAGVKKLLRELETFYDRLEPILRLPNDRYESEMKKLLNEVEEHPNPIIPKFLTVFVNCREREFATEARLAMARAAVQYRLHGKEGLKSVKDPFSGEPFEFRRVSFNGDDRGFELRSAFSWRGYNEVLIFVEKEGPAFMLEGKRAGEPPLKN